MVQMDSKPLLPARRLRQLHIKSIPKEQIEMSEVTKANWCKYKPEVYCQESMCIQCILYPYGADWMTMDEYVDSRNNGFPIALEHAMRIN